ncbi:MAG: hypothetical protein HC888_15395 [Candidatus Competibacteraceae bacterium]|nr:hypothetical protein [Candidatus Competibacteraceae bacterium]
MGRGGEGDEHRVRIGRDAVAIGGVGHDHDGFPPLLEHLGRHLVVALFGPVEEVGHDDGIVGRDGLPDGGLVGLVGREAYLQIVGAGVHGRAVGEEGAGMPGMVRVGRDNMPIAHLFAVGCLPVDTNGQALLVSLRYELRQGIAAGQPVAVLCNADGQQMVFRRVERRHHCVAETSETSCSPLWPPKRTATVFIAFPK